MGHSLPWHHQSTKTKSRTEKLLCLHGVVSATLQKRHLLFPPKPPFATRAHFRTTAAMTAELDGNRQRARAIVFICDVDAFQCVAGCSGTA